MHDAADLRNHEEKTHVERTVGSLKDGTGEPENP
jgi:hypothetical protein